MWRSTGLVPILSHAGPSLSSFATTRNFGTIGNFSFSSIQDAPTSSLSGEIKINVKPTKNAVDVSASVDGAAVKTKYNPSDLRKLQNNPIKLFDVTRTSVLHTSLVDYLLQLSNERYQVLAKWPDFTTMFGKEYYYRAHPEDLKKFYTAVDEFHRMWDVLTEFESLSNLAGSLVPVIRKRRMNTVHPFLTPSSANTALANFFVSRS